MIHVLDDVTSPETNKELEEYFDKQELSPLIETVPTKVDTIYQQTPYEKEISCNTIVLDDDIFNVTKVLFPVISAMNPIVGDVLMGSIRMNLINNPKSENHTPFHRDYPNEHWIGIYYINDSDGDTIVFDDGEAKYISPKRDRLLFFPGQFHAIDLKKDIVNRKIVNYAFALKNP